MRRRTFIAAASTAIGAGLTGWSLPASAAGDLTLRLPAPTGSRRVGTTMLHLIDPDRSDPWNGAATRELMVTVFYPAAGVQGCSRAPQLTPGAAAVFKGLDAGVLHQELPVHGVDWGATMSHSYVAAPAQSGRHPVLLYSPGGADPRTIGTSLAEDLASHGYVVVTIDHPGETSEVDFLTKPPRVIELPPDGPTNPEILRTMLNTRFADIKFVLDQLQGALPRGLGIDLRRVGIYGHSAGGATAAEAMYEDRRIRAAVNLEGYLDYLDGEIFPIAQHGTDRPLLLAGTDGFRDARFDRTWSALLDHGGPVWRTEVRDANHWVFTDYGFMAPQLQRAGLMTAAARDKLIGPGDRAPAVRALVRSFFDRTL